MADVQLPSSSLSEYRAQRPTLLAREAARALSCSNLYVWRRVANVGPAFAHLDAAWSGGRGGRPPHAAIEASSAWADLLRAVDGPSLDSLDFPTNALPGSLTWVKGLRRSVGDDELYVIVGGRGIEPQSDATIVESVWSHLAFGLQQWEAEVLRAAALRSMMVVTELAGRSSAEAFQRTLRSLCMSLSEATRWLEVSIWVADPTLGLVSASSLPAEGGIDAEHRPNVRAGATVVSAEPSSADPSHQASVLVRAGVPRGLARTFSRREIAPTRVTFTRAFPNAVVVTGRLQMTTDVAHGLKASMAPRAVSVISDAVNALATSRQKITRLSDVPGESGLSHGDLSGIRRIADEAHQLIASTSLDGHSRDRDDELFDKTLTFLSDLVPQADLLDIRRVSRSNELTFLEFAAHKGAGWDIGSIAEQARRLAKRFPLGQSPPDSAGDAVFQGGRTVHYPDVGTLTAVAPYSETFEQTRSLVVAPVLVHGEVVATLDARSTSTTLNQRDAYLIELVAGQLGTALLGMRLVDDLQVQLDELARVREDLDAQNQERQRLILNLKHQVRTFLHNAQLYLERISSSGDISNTEGRRNFAGLRGEVARARRVAGSSIFGSVVSGATPDARVSRQVFAATDILKLLIELAADYEAVSKQRYCNVDRTYFEGSDWTIAVDKSLLEQSLGCLLDNAIKYSSRGSTIEIFGVEAPGQLGIAVRSRGLPFPASEVRKAFRHGYRSEAARMTTSEGEGIGLTMVSDLLKIEGGAIHVTPAPQRNDPVTVVLSFPFRT